MIASRIDRQSHNFNVSALELWFNLGHVAEFGRADRGEVLRVREQNGPGVSNPVMEADSAFGGFCFKIRCCIANFHLLSSGVVLRKSFSQVPKKKSISDNGCAQCTYGAIKSQNLLRSMLPPE